MPFRALLCALLLATLPASPALAQQWRADGARAGFAKGGALAGLVFECRPGGRLRTIVAGNGASFPADRDLTVAFDVDGTAWLRPFRAEPEGGGASRFVREEPLAEARDLLEALRRGSSLEIAGPAGRVALPLAGSGRAIGALLERCGV